MGPSVDDGGAYAINLLEMCGFGSRKLTMHMNSSLTFCLDIFSQPLWQQISDIQDSELKELAVTLPMVVLQSRAPSTIKKYSGAFLHWKRWALSKQADISVLPANPLHVTLYLMFIIKKSSTSAPVEEAVNALSWAHQVAFVDDPTCCNIVKATVVGVKRLLAHRTQKKEPITPEILKNLVERFAP